MTRKQGESIDIFIRWLEWLDSHDGRLYRCTIGQQGTDMDILGTIPNPPGSAILTVGDLRNIVDLVKEKGLGE